MTAIARHRFDHAAVDPAFWPALAAAAADWLARQGLAAREAVLLLPQHVLLAPARAAFAGLGGWQPRIETPSTLAASLGPVPPPTAGALSGDRVIDRLSAAALLRSQSGFAAWRERDPRLFDDAVAALVDSAQALARAAHERAPAARAAWWAGLRDALPPLHGPGATERQLARIALEWAALADPPATERLWTLDLSAWIGIELAGEDSLIAALLAHASARGQPALCLSADPPGDAPFAAAASLPPPCC
jgi:ATP-dependent helicase/nuclease subunit B